MDVPIEDLDEALRRIASDDGVAVSADASTVELIEAIRSNVKPGPRGKVRLGIRRRKGYPPTIYTFKEGKPVETTGVVPTKEEEENPYLSVIARVKMELYIQRQSRGAGKDIKLVDVPVSAALDEILEDRKKRKRKRRAQNRVEERVQELRSRRTSVLKGHVKQLNEFFDKSPKRRMTIGDINDNTGWDYVAFRCERVIKSQKATTKSTKRYPTEWTARVHLKTLRMMLNEWRRKHRKKGHVDVDFTMPPPPDANTVRATWDQMARLTLAITKGLKFNEDTTFRRKTVAAADGTVTSVLDTEPPEVIAEFEPLRRVLAIGIYAGARAGNGTHLRWGFGDLFGCLDPKRGRFHGDGQGELRTPKRREDRRMLAPLTEMSLEWEADDLAAGHIYVIHDADGRKLSLWQIRQLFKRAAANAGIPWMLPVHLKPTGATLLTYAGLPIADLALKFSTKMETLLKHYVHLLDVWQGPTLEYRPENLKPKRLRRGSPVSAARIAMFAAAAERSEQRAR